MAVYAFTNGYVLLNAVNLSDHTTKATLDCEVEDLDTTAFSSTGWTTHLGGLKSGTLSLEFNQDFAAGSVNATIWAAFGTSVAFEVRPVNSARSATNPAYTGNVLITQVSPISNGVGEKATMSVTFPVDGAVTQQTA